MTILYYVLILLTTSIITTCLYFLIKKYNNKKELIFKIVSISLFCIYLFRSMLAPVAITKTIGLNIHSPFGYNAFKTLIALLLIWFNNMSILLLVLFTYFKSNNLKNILKFFSFPIFIITYILFAYYGIGICGKEAFSGFNVHLLIVAIELSIALAYSIILLVSKDYFKFNKKELKKFFISIGLMLLASIPAYAIQVFYGNGDSYLKLKSFTFEHRIMLYTSIIIPILIYYGFKNKDENVKRFSMIYLLLATLITFVAKYPFSVLANPLRWPLHLCNTAMFVLPLCLIFRMNKLFYFTFFINVMGAFLAMAMPNTGDYINALSNESLIFWINHLSAFFMPVLLVALGLFKRPKMKEWAYSMIAFGVYFVFILVINAWFSNYGSVDYFFLNSDFIVDKFGDWARDTRNIIWAFNIGELKFVFYPVYQFLFFVVYIFISLAMWFLYEQLFQMWDLGNDIRERNRKYNLILKEVKMIEKKGEINVKDVYLELKNFSKKYGVNKHYSVKDVSFKVNGGEIFGFLGPNGAGKSTIIKSIVGIQTITSGNINVCGFDVEKQSVSAKKEIGFVPDHYALYENLTGREYINFIADLYEVSKEDRDARINKYVTNFNLEAAFDNQMKTYSHGMKQKITIMAALVHNPKVWILDEPLTGLDPTSIYEVKECMKEHAKEGNIVFFSSHIIDVVEKICDRIAIIKKGNLLCDVKVKDLDKKKINLEDFYLEKINSDGEEK